MMGPHRVLRILVDPRAADRDLMASIGHELQHAVEVLNHRSVRSSSQMILLYRRICDDLGLSLIVWGIPECRIQRQWIRAGPELTQRLEYATCNAA